MKKIEKVLEKIRPTLQRDGGNVELINYDKKTGILELSFIGACAHCPASDFTLHNLIEQEIKSKISEVKKVISV